MKIDNHTEWSGRDISSVIRAVCKASFYKPPTSAVVRVEYSRKGRYTGWAMYNARLLYNRGLEPKRRKKPCSMLLRVPRPEQGLFDMNKFLGLVMHEVAHWRGVKHRDMGISLLYCRFNPEGRPWAAKLEVRRLERRPTAWEHLVDEKPSPMVARVQARAAHAQKMLKLHEGKLAREKNLVAKWKAKVKYYDKRKPSVESTTDG